MKRPESGRGGPGPSLGEVPEAIEGVTASHAQRRGVTHH
jgi:hypothetical protein